MKIGLRYIYILLAVVLFSSFCSIGREAGTKTETEPPAVEEKDDTKTPGKNPGPEKTKTTETKIQPIQREPEVEVQDIDEKPNSTISPSAGEGVYQSGQASWYGPDFHGNRTANGERYDMNKLTAAHKELPFHTLVEVENIDNQKKIIVRINDRGPFVKGRIIDLSKKAARRIDMLDSGTAPVHLRIVKTSAIKKRTVKPKKHGIEVAPSQRPRPSGGFFLQAGAFSLRENAKRMVQHLKDVLPGISFSIRYIGGNYKVISRELPSRTKAESWKQKLLEHGFDSFIKKE
ncbi:MAG: septal ring lytic transglycosylase RlpA family protein [bacterium]|nr:septal ring lytic transglycosylase RlpA family protein [bacterium]